MAAANATENTASSSRRGLKQILVIASISLLVIVAVIEIAPFVMTVANSFKCQAAAQNSPFSLVPVPPYGVSCFDEEGQRRPYTEMVSGATFNPTTYGYELILNEQLPLWMFNTAFYSVAVTICRVLLDSMAGYALARLRFRGNRAFFFFILGVQMIPGVVLLIPRFILLKQLGMLDSYHGYIITLAVDAFGILLMKQFFESIPQELEEAAMVDGASRFRIFFTIILPLATPALVALTIFSFQGQWNNFTDALLIVGRNPELYNLPLGLSVLRGAGETVQYERALPGAVITVLPIAIIFFIFQRYFIEGVSYSGLKG